MSSPIEGQINEKLHKIAESDFDGGPLAIDAVDNELQLVKEISTSRFFPLKIAGDAGDEYIYCTPPRGKVYIIHDLRAWLQTDATVADRVFSMVKQFQSGDLWISLKDFVLATVVAETMYNVELHQAASADPPPSIDCFIPRENIIIAGRDMKGRFGERLRLRDNNKQLGDTMAFQLSIEERDNYML